MICADIHEPESIIRLLREKTDITVENLTSGDYVFPPVGIERKTYSDFLQSVKTKRLFEQLKRLKQSYPQTYLIIEAPYLMNMFNDSLQCALPTYRIMLYLMECDIKVLFSPGPEHTAEIVFLIYNRKKRTFPTRICTPPRYKPKILTLKERQMFFLQGMPGIGKKTAMKISAAFPTIQSFLDANPNDLKGILGQKKRKHMKEMLTEKFVSNENRNL